MKAVILKGFGGVENLFVADIPVPSHSANEVLVKVKAFSINPVDMKTRLGRGVASRLKDMNPMILGWDVSGTVEEVGKSVKNFKKGDEVFGMIKFPDPGSTYAEYVSAPESQLALKPQNISHEEAAAASLAALTAWQILKDRAAVKPGDKVLIHSAAGGVGHYAIQMANYMKAYVAGTSSGMNREFVLGLGASEHIDYEKQQFDKILKNFDFVLDARGGDYIDRSLTVLRTGGTIVSIPSGASESVVDKARKKGMTGWTFSVRPNTQNIQEIAGLLGEGKLKSHVSHIFSINDIQAAHRQIESGKTRGKIVIALT